MIKRECIESKVKEVLAEYFGITEEQVHPESHIYNDLGADSLDQVDVIMQCEEYFDIDIPDEEEAKIQYVKELIDVIEKLKNK
jgi:acyl carrier protein